MNSHGRLSYNIPENCSQSGVSAFHFKKQFMHAESARKIHHQGTGGASEATYSGHTGCADHNSDTS